MPLVLPTFQRLWVVKPWYFFGYPRTIPLSFVPWPFDIKINIPQVENTKPKKKKKIQNQASFQ